MRFRGGFDCVGSGELQEKLLSNLAALLFFQDNQSPDYPGYPTGKREEQHYDERAAALVDNGKGRENDCKKHS